MKGRGRRTAWCSGAGVLVLVGVGVVGKDRFVEAWYLRDLGSEVVTERFRAARKLGEMRSSRAVPGLVALLKEFPGHTAEAREVWGPRTVAGKAVSGVLGAIGPPAVPALAQALKDSRGEKKYWRRYACRALAETRAKAAVPALIDLLDDQDACVRMTAFQVLGSMGSEATEAVPALTARVGMEKGALRHFATQALKEIRAARPQRGG